MKHLFLIAITVIVAGVVIFIWHPRQESASQMPTKVIQVAGLPITVSIADTPATQRLGLGGRLGLNPNEGMLFVFPRDDVYAFWMKDMHFSIDIIWLAVDGTVITIAPDVSPSTYPHNFVPTAPSRYVLELSAGFSARHGLKVGDIVRW